MVGYSCLDGKDPPVPSEYRDRLPLPVKTLPRPDPTPTHPGHPQDPWNRTPPTPTGPVSAVVTGEPNSTSGPGTSRPTGRAGARLHPPADLPTDVLGALCRPYRRSARLRSTPTKRPRVPRTDRSLQRRRPQNRTLGGPLGNIPSSPVLSPTPRHGSPGGTTPFRGEVSIVARSTGAVGLSRRPDRRRTRRTNPDRTRGLTDEGTRPHCNDGTQALNRTRLSPLSTPWAGPFPPPVPPVQSAEPGRGTPMSPTSPSGFRPKSLWTPPVYPRVSRRGTRRGTTVIERRLASRRVSRSVRSPGLQGEGVFEAPQVCPPPPGSGVSGKGSRRERGPNPTSGTATPKSSGPGA